MIITINKRMYRHLGAHLFEGLKYLSHRFLYDRQEGR